MISSDTTPSSAGFSWISVGRAGFVSNLILLPLHTLPLFHKSDPLGPPHLPVCPKPPPQQRKLRVGPRNSGRILLDLHILFYQTKSSSPFKGSGPLSLFLLVVNNSLHVFLQVQSPRESNFQIIIHERLRRNLILLIYLWELKPMISLQEFRIERKLTLFPTSPVIELPIILWEHGHWLSDLLISELR